MPTWYFKCPEWRTLSNGHRYFADDTLLTREEFESVPSSQVAIDVEAFGSSPAQLESTQVTDAGLGGIGL